MQKLITAYRYSAGSMLLALATALFLANLSKAPLNNVPVREPMLALPLPVFFWGLGGILLIVALLCLFGRRIKLQLAVVLWICLNLMVYRIGLPFMGVTGGLSGYLGRLAGAFGVSSGTMTALLAVAVFYLFIGGCIALVLVGAVERAKLANPSAKMICAQCGGHIEFFLRNLGQEISCPHCQAGVTLHKPDEPLKMSCFFCQGHIAFPVHALGTKMPCPHCKKDITLLEAK